MAGAADERKDGQTKRHTDEWTDERINEWMDERADLRVRVLRVTRAHLKRLDKIVPYVLPLVTGGLKTLYIINQL